MSAKKLHYFLPLLVCLYLLFTLSSQPYHEQSIIPLLSRHIAQEELAAWLPDLNIRFGRQWINAKSRPYDFVEFIFRKGAHVLSYTVLGCTIFHFLNVIKPAANRTPVRLAGMMLGLSAAAFLDEWNQTRVDMRMGQMSDVWLDLIGGTLGACLMIPVVRNFRRKGNGAPALKFKSSR